MHRSLGSSSSPKQLSASHVAVSSHALGSAAASGRNQTVDDIVSQYVLGATLPSERKVPRSYTPPARSHVGTLPSTGLVHSPVYRGVERYSDIRRSETHLAEIRSKMDRAGRNADDVASTTKELERSKTVLAELETENVQLRSRIRSITALVEEKEQSIREMEATLRHARQQLTETEELRIQDMTTLRKQISLLQQENSDLAARCDHLRLAIASRDGDASMSRDELRQRLAQLETQLETSRATNFRLSTHIDEKEHQLKEMHKLQAEIPRLESEAKDAMQRLQEAQKLMQQKEEERVKNQEQHLRQLRDLSQQLESWKREMNRVSDRGFEHHQLQSEAASRAGEKDQEIIAEVSEKVRANMDELRRKQIELERLQIENRRLTEENRILREAASAKDFVSQESGMLRAQVRQLEETVTLMQQLNGDLKTQLEKKEAAAAAEASTHLHEVELLKRELGNAKSEMASLESLKKENHKLRKETQKGPNADRVNELRAEKSVLEQEVTELREKLIGMTANAIQVERIYAEQLDDLQKEVAQLKLKEADCRANHLNPERELQLESRTHEIEVENEMLRQRMEANLKLHEELEGEKKKELLKREQQQQLQSQLSALTFARPDYHGRTASPRNAQPSGVALTAAEMYSQRLQRASGSTPAQPLPSSQQQQLPSVRSPPSALDEQQHHQHQNTGGASALLRMTSSVDSKGSWPSAKDNPVAQLASTANSFMRGNLQRSASPKELEATASFSNLPKPVSAVTLVGPNRVAPASTITYTKDGVGSIRFGTISQLFFAAAQSGGDTVAIKTEKHPRGGDDQSGNTMHAPAGAVEWTELTWPTYYIKAAQFAKALISHRCEPNASVMIVSSGSTEANIAFAGSVLAGCLPCPAFPNSPLPHLIRQIEETAAEIIVLDDVQLLQRLLNTTRRMQSIKQFVVLHSGIPPSLKTEYGQMVATFDQFLALCAYVTDTMLQTRIDGQYVEHPVCIVYTPGSTGEPKGVLLSHDNLQFSAAAFAQTMVLTDGDAVAHLALTQFADAHGIVMNVILPLITVASKGIPFVTHFVDYRGDPQQLPVYFRGIRPTFLIAGPGIYQDILLSIRAYEQEARSESDAKLLQWAKNLARESSFQRQRDILSRVPSGPIKGAQLAASMNDKTKAALGLDRVVQTICAGGPLAASLLEGFASSGFDLLQLYTSTETTGIACVSAEACFQFGTCGFHLPSTELQIDIARSDRSAFREGEVLTRGRHVMLGYLINLQGSNPINSDGWYRTGDLGKLDPDTGLLTIVGRIRDQVVVYPTGSPSNPSERISPQRIELEILRVCPALSHVLVFGEQRKYLVALMTLKSRRNPLTGGYTDDLVGEALDVNPEVLTVTTARRDEKWLKYIAGVIAQCNSVAENATMKVKRFCILPSDFTVLGGELTANEKVRRAAVQTKYSALVDKLYAEEGSSSATPRKS